MFAGASVCAHVCIRVLGIVSPDKLLRRINTLIIIYFHNLNDSSNEYLCLSSSKNPRFRERKIDKRSPTLVQVPSCASQCPQYLLDKLQKVQNAAARLVCKAKKSDHIHLILETLHWLPVTHRIQYKISTTCFNSISGTAPQYLSDLFQPCTPARQLRSASYTRTFVTPV